MEWSIIGQYSFCEINSPIELREELRQITISYPFCGTQIIAKEGINGTVASTENGIKTLLEFLYNNKITNVIYTKSASNTKPFKRTKLKIKENIVTIGTPVKPMEIVGKYVEPKEWNNILKDDNFLVIDTRNEYEYRAGTFIGAINPHTKCFSEFPNFLKSNIDKWRNKKIAMFCTGGIRCEKSTSFALQQGLNDVYHLKGGILRYLEEIPEEESLWEGECFIFDERIVLRHGLKQGFTKLCNVCGWTVLPHEQNDRCFQEKTGCPHCTTQIPQNSLYLCNDTYSDEKILKSIS